MSSVEYTRSKIHYDSFCALWPGENWLRTSFPQHVYATSPAVLREYDHYKDCFWDVYEVASDNVPGSNDVELRSWKGKRFPLVQHLYSFIRGSCERHLFIDNSPRHAIYVRVYDVVDADVPVIDKVYGINTFYHMLHGARARTNTPLSLDLPGGVDWPDAPAWFESLRAELSGDIGAGPPLADESRVVWFPSGPKKLYGLPRTGFGIPLPNASPPHQRRVWRTTSGGSLQEITASYANFANTPSSAGWDIHYCDLDLSSLTWVWNGPAAGRSAKAAQDGAGSRIILYHMSAGSDHAVYVKPVGIDRVGLPWFDSNLYDLYGMYTVPGISVEIRKIAGIDPGFQTVRRGLTWVDLHSWIPPGKKRLGANAVGWRMPATSFFLRDKLTGRISPASSARIVLSKGHRNAPFKFEVKPS